ncbi:MAG TPA: hypothetical protein VMJ14_11400 [Burkholderiales bacterium]|nr:hypothetical protein [Burkholderiales bacterium]
MKLLKILTVCILALAASPLFAQNKSAVDSMQILHDKLKGDKKLMVAANMDLTDAEAKGFWPVYEDYQKELKKINDRTAALIIDYAKEFNANTLTDEKAKKMIHEQIAIEESEVKLKSSFVPKLIKVLPGKKAARYLQIESKVRAVVKYELADAIPLVQ